MEDKFILGAIESPIDLRDYDYSMISCSSDKIDIPDEFRLDYDYQILNQGSIGSCVAHALSCMKSYIDGVNTDNMYSVGFIYANRQEDDFQGTGMITREALKNLVKYGDCKKSSFPVNEEYPAIVDTLKKYGKEKLLDEADDYKSLAYVSLETENIKEYLVKYQKPILITVRVYDNLYEANSNGGIIPSEPEGNKRGGHAMLCIGYKEDTLILINSWGDYNGDKGKYYLDINSSIIKELWALEDKKKIKEPEKKKYKLGWNKDNKGWWFSTDGETYCKEEWKQIKGEYYYFNKEGYALDSEWIQSPRSKKWYYLEKDTCKMLSNCWIKDKGKWYRLEKDGSMLTGWFQDSNSKWYYLDLDQGYMYSSCTILIDGEYYTFNSSGAWVKNNLVAKEQLQQVGWKNVSDLVLKDLNSCLEKFNINTPGRIRHFISQCSHESGCGKWAKELDTGETYEGKRDLGNTQTGDGKKFKGAGYLQLTGRSNYQALANYLNDQSIMLGVDYVATNYPWTSAAYWWYKNNMNSLCDKGATCKEITYRVNGGYNGLEDRENYYKKCCNIFK